METQPSCSVVLVEDLADFRNIVQKVLELDGHTVATAADGPAGLELIRRLQPDIAFIDIGLPRVDGYSMARALRAEGVTTYLVALTAYGGDANRLRAIEAGFDRHVLKPLLPDERREICKTAAERRRGAQE